jgi:TolB-like protein
MHKIGAITLILLFLHVICTASDQQKISIAVLELAGGGISPHEIQGMTSRLRSELFETRRFQVLERQQMDDILHEQGFQQNNCTNTACVVQAGRLIGVQQMVAGSISKIGSIFTLDIRLIDVETGKVIQTVYEDCECPIETVLQSTIKTVAVTLARSGEKPAYKSPLTAFFFSLIVPGSGQLYNGEYLKGALQMGGIIATGLMVSNNEKYDNDEAKQTVTFGLGIFIGIWAWSIIDAPISAGRINREIDHGFSHLFQLSGRNYCLGGDVIFQNKQITGKLFLHF